MKISLILGFILLLLMPFMTALVIDDTAITIKIFPISTIPNWNSTTVFDGTITFRVEFSDDEFGNDENYTFVLQPNTTTSSTKSFEFLFIKNETIDSNLLNKHIICLNEKSLCEIEKGKLDLSYTKCNLDLVEFEDGNLSKTPAELASCNLFGKEKDLDITAKQKEIDNLTKDAENTKNSKWFYVLIALVAGAVAMNLYRENKGGGAAKDKSMDEWPKGQAG